MSTYRCYDMDRKENWYLLTVEIKYDKKGVRSDTVIRVIHYGQVNFTDLLNRYDDNRLYLPGHDGYLLPFSKTVNIPIDDLLRNQPT